ncbi:MAG: TonB-dependent receptor [Acidobacteria bacterium]|nr:TonB-dependent receptor [Acidobacteriota bacterium]
MTPLRLRHDRRFRSAAAALLLLTFLLVPPAWSQEARGTIVGTITDSTGAVIPSAKVDVISKTMGTKVSLTTNESGHYQAAYLIPGEYQVVAQSDGFKRFVRDGIEVRVNDRVEVNLSLEVGGTEQSVTVTGETPLLNTTSSSLGQVVDGRRVSELPIPHGNPYFLIGLASGVSFTRDPRLDRPFEPTHIVGYSMDGTKANRSDVTIDGAPSTATANAGEVISSYVPPADLVAEFKVQTATFDASFGQTEGGVTNISLKSGTNALHGTAYYNKMAPELFANDYFANANRIARPEFTYDRWGGVAGGPVFIPKLYDGRNKTFFQYGYEGIHESRPRNNGTATVPTMEMRNGDFSKLLALGANYQIYNPFTRATAAGGRFSSQPFAGNIIPASLFNPISKKVLDTYYPAPLSAGNADGTNNFQNPSLPENIKYATHSVRIDHTLSDKQRVFGRYSWYDRDSNYNDYFNNAATGEYFLFVSRSAVFDDVYTLTPTTVLNVRYGYNRFIRGTNAGPDARGFDATSLGFPSSFNNLTDASTRRFPRFDITGYQGTGVGGEYRPIDTHSFNGTVQKSIGAHFLKTGMEFRAYRENSLFFANNQTGQFNFDASWTRGPLDNSPTAPGSLGQSVAAFLLGLPNNSSFVARPASYAEQSLSWGFFVHDDWKVTRKLSLNLGVRWEFEGALTERYNRSVKGFDTSVVQPFEGAAQTAYARNPTPEVAASQFLSRGGLNFVGIGGQSRGVYDTPKRNLMPRIGFAYQADPKTVIRGGYGIFFGFLGQRRGDVIQSGFSRNTPFFATTDNLNFTGSLSNPFPNGVLEPLGAAQGTLTFVGQGITFFDQQPVMPYMQRWQLSIQREVGQGFVVEGLYVGNRGNNVEMSQNLNVTPQQYLSTSPTRDNTRINYLSANLPNPYLNLLPAGAIAGLTSVNIGRERLLRPYPHFDGVTHARFDGYSWYHSAQLQVEKRFSRGYTVMLNYTFSKFMQASELLNQDDPRPVEVISEADRPHRLTISGIWELPFGRGKMLGGELKGIANGLIGGWQLSGIYSLQSGAPINFGNVIFNGDVKNLRLDGGQQSLAQWFNVNAGFERNSALQLDRNIRNFPLRFGFLRADKINNYDLSLIKNTRFKESLNAQFKAEFLNAFNHPLFGAPNTNPAVVQFGTIQTSTQANYARRIQLTAKFIF